MPPIYPGQEKWDELGIEGVEERKVIDVPRHPSIGGVAKLTQKGDGEMYLDLGSGDPIGSGGPRAEQVKLATSTASLEL